MFDRSKISSEYLIKGASLVPLQSLVYSVNKNGDRSVPCGKSQWKWSSKRKQSSGNGPFVSFHEEVNNPQD